MTAPSDQSVILICSTCAGASFEYDDVDNATPVRCVTCDRVFTREELLAENQEVIGGAVEVLKAEIIDDFRKSLKQALRGSKFIKVR